VPTLAVFKQRFLDQIRVECKEHTKTIAFYQAKYSGLLRFAPLAQARLNRIDEELIARFIAKLDREDYEESTINRHLATLKRDATPGGGLEDSRSRAEAQTAHRRESTRICAYSRSREGVSGGVPAISPRLVHAGN
jgi:hypothetical protein